MDEELELDPGIATGQPARRTAATPFFDLRPARPQLALRRSLPLRAPHREPTQATAGISRLTAEEVLDRLMRGVVIVDRVARILFANEAARRIFERGDGLRVDPDGHIVLPAKDLQRRFATFLGRVLPDLSDSATFRVERGSRAQPYRMVATPLTGPTLRQLAGGSGPLHALFIHEPVTSQTIPRRILRELYGLTPAEAEVAALLFSGHSVHDTARVSGTSVNTVRSHLKRIFAKCGVDSQAALLKLLALGPLAL